LPCSVGGNTNDYAGVGEPGSFNCEAPGLGSSSVGEFWQQNGQLKFPHQFAGPNGGAGSPQWFSTMQGNNPVFTQPAAGTFVTQRGVRDNIYSPGLENNNLTLIKNFPIYEQNALQFHAEAYDWLNHPNLSGVNDVAGTATFGEITAKTGLSRTLQVGLRYSF